MSAVLKEAPADTTALVAVDSIKLALTELDKIQQGLAELKTKYAGVVFDVKTSVGMKEAAAARVEIREPRYSVEKVRKAAKAPVLELGRSIDQRAAWITEELLQIEGPIDAQIKAEEKRKEDEREARIKAEQERIAKIQACIGDYKQVLLDAVGCTSEQIAVSLANLVEATNVSWAQEFADIAEEARVQTIGKMRALYTQVLEQEVKQEQLRLEREELQRLRAEQDERERIERERVEAARIQQEGIERAAREKIEAEQRASRDKIEQEEREARARQEEADRQAKAAREAEEARLRAIREEEENRLRAERERLEKERLAAEERDRKAKEAAEAKARAKREKEEAAERERLRKLNEVMDARQMLEAFVTRFGHLKEFASVVRAIEASLAKEKKAA